MSSVTKQKGVHLLPPPYECFVSLARLRALTALLRDTRTRHCFGRHREMSCLATRSPFRHGTLDSPSLS